MIDFTIDGYRYKSDHGVYWKLIFFSKQNNENDFHESVEKYLSSNTDKIYSIIEEESNKSILADKYEFLLDYPQKNGYNRWKQTNFPLNEKDNTTKSTAEGYEPIHISFTEQYWGGLLKSGDSCALIEGSIGSTNWWYTIGYKRRCHRSYIHVFPGPGKTVNEVYWWMRSYVTGRLLFTNHKHYTSNNCFMIMLICFYKY